MLYKEIAVMHNTACRKLLPSQSQQIFEQGERTGRFLAWLARERFTTSHIAKILDENGSLQSETVQINAQFVQFYNKLHPAKVEYLSGLHRFSSALRFG